MSAPEYESIPVIARRLLWVVPIHAALGVFLLFYALCYGPREALSLFRRF